MSKQRQENFILINLFRSFGKSAWLDEDIETSLIKFSDDVSGERWQTPKKTRKMQNIHEGQELCAKTEV